MKDHYIANTPVPRRCYGVDDLFDITVKDAETTHLVDAGRLTKVARKLGYRSVSEILKRNRAPAIA